MSNTEPLLQLNPLAKCSVKDMVRNINDRSHLYRIFEHVEHRELELLADLALEELRIRALSGRFDPRAVPLPRGTHE